MKAITLAGAAILALGCTIGAAWSDDGGAPAWLDTVAGQKLIAVDGSSITLSPSDDKLTLAMASPTGAAQTRVFVLMTDNMGTVADNADGSHVIGFFRVTDSGLEEQFSDGHSETLALNAAGGLSLSSHLPAGATCTAWYPPGHVFSEAERRAAVADYASRLGLSQVVSIKAPHGAPCAAQKPAPYVIPPSPRGLHRATDAALTANDAPIMVRTSVVHAVDGGLAVPAKAEPQAAWSPPVAPAAQQTASAEAPPETGHGASDCLSVESDGANLGFRNQCGYGVQFAYCLQTTAQVDANCDAGAKTGAVAANGFTPVLFDTNIKAGDAEHDFRWVGCSGGAGDVAPHLDRIDPPAGRCVLTKSS
jgi:hypothetical protein